MRTVIVIQARMGSTRLPGKSMMDIGGMPLIMRVVKRARLSKEADEVAIATTDEAKDDVIADFMEKAGIPCYRGDPKDVLDRYYQAARKFKADIVVRTTGDCPLVDPSLIDRIVKIFKKGGFDYAANTNPPFMDGFDVEVFSFKALEEAQKEARMLSEREHVTPYIRNSRKFRKCFIENDPRLAKVHCSVDRMEDLEFVRRIYSEIGKKGKGDGFTYEDVIEILQEKPEILAINEGSIINEGYAKSLKEDKEYSK